MGLWNAKLWNLTLLLLVVAHRVYQRQSASNSLPMTLVAIWMYV